MSASEINGLDRFIQRSFYENAAVTNFLFFPSCQLVVQICAGPQISGRDGMMLVMASSRVPALERTWAKSFNLSRSVISNAFVSFERLARYTSAFSRRRAPPACSPGIVFMRNKSRKETRR